MSSCDDCKYRTRLLPDVNGKAIYMCSKGNNLSAVETLKMKCADFEQYVVSETPQWKEEVETIASGIKDVPLLLTAKELYAIYGKNKSLCEQFAPTINDAMIAYKITSHNRMCAFVATIGVESGRLKYTTELGNDAYFAKYEPTTNIGKQLGNKEKGDGAKYKGRGLIQITGRYNYEQVSKAIGVDFISRPELLAELPHSVFASAWWWQKNGLNSIADTEDLKAVRKKVNGGLNGYSEFVAIYKTAKKVFV